MNGPAASGRGGVSGPHIFLVAGEESGDRLGGALMRALKEQTQGRVRISGVGGRDMVAEGLDSLFDLGTPSIVGFSSVLSSLEMTLQRIRVTSEAAVAANPDVLVIIDSPEFTQRVARRVRKLAPSIPIVDYVCPQVWAWRSGRAKTMRAYIDHVLAVLPFEPEALKRLGGPPCTYVGHSLSERVGELRPAGNDTGARLADPPLLLVMPGSRTAEIRRLAGTFGEAVALAERRVGTMEIVVPAVAGLAASVRDAVAKWPVAARVVVDPAVKLAAFRRARAALTKSGTSTLELAVAGIPMVGAYKVSAIEAMVGHLLIKVKTAILTNHVLGEAVVPEFIQGDCTAENLSDALVPLLSDTPQRRRQVEAYKRLDAIMEVGTASPSSRAASIVLDYAARRSRAAREMVAPETAKA